MRREDPFEARSRALCLAAGQDPDSRVDNPAKPGKTMPLWTTFRDAARADWTAERQAQAVAGIGEQPAAYRDSPLAVFGAHEEATVTQMQNCMAVGNAVAGVLCADGHLGYAQPVGGVIAYDTRLLKS